MSKEGFEGVRNTCFSELKNVTVDKFRAGLVLNVVQNSLSISSRQKSSEKVKNGRFLFLPDLTPSSYPHKLQNLSFNLVVNFFCAS
jgi:hypothetical protein